MKVRIEIDLTPEEARSFMGMPDMSGIHEAFVNEAKTKIAQTAGLMDIDPLVKTWTGFGGVAQEALGSLFGAALRAGTGTAPRSTAATTTAAKSDKTDKPADPA
jgi:hypothetical protein